MDLDKIIKQCRNQNRQAQKALYDRYSPLFLGICRRYLGANEDAEDVFLEGMYKIFSNINKFKGTGSFEGWMKRIIVNECLMHIRKNKNLKMHVEWTTQDKAQDPDVIHQLGAEEIKALINELPPGYRTVFNLYVIEGYKHREIAELLGISINTSKSQLILAKKKLKAMLKKKDFELNIRNL